MLGGTTCSCTSLHCSTRSWIQMSYRVHYMPSNCISGTWLQRWFLLLCWAVRCLTLNSKPLQTVCWLLNQKRLFWHHRSGLEQALVSQSLLHLSLWPQLLLILLVLIPGTHSLFFSLTLSSWLKKLRAGQNPLRTKLLSTIFNHWKSSMTVLRESSS